MNSSTSAPLTWRVHLLRREPRRLPLLLIAIVAAFGCTWVLFASPLPAFAAAALLIGSIADYLFPIRYRIDSEGVAAASLTGRFRIGWHEVRRCLPARSGVLLSPLPAPSRLDLFRGVLVRFAEPGQPGDELTVSAALAVYAPDKKAIQL